MNGADSIVSNSTEVVWSEDGPGGVLHHRAVSDSEEIESRPSLP